MTSIRRIALTCTLSGVFGLAGIPLANAQSVVAVNAPAVSRPAIDTRWDASFAAFAEEDRLHAPKPGGVLFVGSSSIRMWSDLETDFKSLPVVVKRGFGGSRMLDCATHLQKLVTPYKPKVVLVYAGDNDLAEGLTPQDVLKSFSNFVEGVRDSLPDTRIVYISIKPSPSRTQLLPQIRETNAMIQSYTQSVANAAYIDIFTPMMNASGKPRGELFREDDLHLNASGYALWRTIISAHLDSSTMGTTQQAAR
jgi:lysophospholipase L1-like esterase